MEGLVAGPLAQALEAGRPRFNARFAVPPEQAGTAYRPLAADAVAAQLFCFKYAATVGSASKGARTE